MKVKVLLFAQMKEDARASHLDVELQSGATVRDVWESVLESLPKYRGLDSSMAFAVNAEYANKDAVVRDGDEIALIPPVSGG